MGEDIQVTFKFRLYPDQLENPHTQAVVLGHDSAIIISLDYPEDMPAELTVTSSLMGRTPEEVAEALEEVARSVREVTAKHDPIIVKADD